VSEESVGKRQFRALGFSGEVKLTPSVVRGNTRNWKPDRTLQSEAVVCMLPVGRKMKMEIPYNSYLSANRTKVELLTVFLIMATNSIEFSAIRVLGMDSSCRTVKCTLTPGRTRGMRRGL
jgi:hypothetical protein